MTTRVRNTVSGALLIGALLFVQGGTHLPPPVFPVPFSALPPPALGEPIAEGADAAFLWGLVKRYSEKYRVQDDAVKIYRVIFEESRFLDSVRSRGGEYLGMCQFRPSTFNYNVKAMKELMLLPKDVRFSPFNPEHAIHVMTWMWSRGYKDHWGPTRRVERQVEGEGEPGPEAVFMAGLANR
jgi:hypothetical protein